MGMSRHLLFASALALASLTLASLPGCGQGTPAPAPTPMRPAAQPTPPPATPAGGDAEAARLRQAVGEVYGRMRSLEATSRSTIRMGGENNAYRTKVLFMKPRTTLVEIESGPDARQKGTRLKWSGGSQVEVKTRFFGLPIQLTVDRDDERIRSIRGDAFDASTVSAFMDVLLDPAAACRFLGEGAASGKPVVFLEVRSRKSLKGLSRDVFAIDRQTMFPIQREGYAGQTAVYRNVISGARMNTLSASDLAL